MTKYIFDTGVFSLYFASKLPEKWIRPLTEVKSGRKKLIFFETVVTEVFIKNAEKSGLKYANEKILEVKSFKGTKITPISDKEAISAGEYNIRNREFKLSMVDSYILSLAKEFNAKVLTTDSGIKQSGKKNNIEVDYLPLDRI